VIDDKAGGDISSEVSLSSTPASSRTVKPSVTTPQLIRPFQKVVKEKPGPRKKNEHGF